MTEAPREPPQRRRRAHPRARVGGDRRPHDEAGRARAGRRAARPRRAARERRRAAAQPSRARASGSRSATTAPAMLGRRRAVRRSRLTCAARPAARAATSAALWRVAGGLMSERLDHGRPLWRSTWSGRSPTVARRSSPGSTTRWPTGSAPSGSCARSSGTEQAQAPAHRRRAPRARPRERALVARRRAAPAAGGVAPRARATARRDTVARPPDRLGARASPSRPSRSPS